MARNLHSKGSSSEMFRVSVSSAPSTSSHGSAHDDFESLGDIYVWGEVICDSQVRNNADRVTRNPNGARTDLLLPKPLESNIVLDVTQVSCGVRHAALVTRQGEVFTWGEELGGRLGHGMKSDVIHPRLVDSLTACHMEFVVCGEFQTCAVTTGGDLYTWGDHTDLNRWIPRRVLGPLEGLQVAYVSCGTWHTALISTAGQLFTFGDGTFGALGHGSKDSTVGPREVETLKGLRTISVACGTWHTAAVVDMMTGSAASGSSSLAGKLFTWGDGDKYRLGHDSKEPQLQPVCVEFLIDYDFRKVACGHSLTVGVTVSGRVFSMGGAVFGQLGNPRSDGRHPCLVEDNISSESVLEVACGSYHVAVLTAKSEVFTWGKGANGRLGHGDVEDRKVPTLVEALKDRSVRHIACGATFTAAICHHKWVPGAEQLQCASCGQSFGFTRKRHHCYNCGLVHCHACSSRKALRAALAPNPAKLHRVCDACFVKLGKMTAAVLPPNTGRKNSKSTAALSITGPGNLDLIRNLDIKATRYGKKTDLLSLLRNPQTNTLLQLRDIAVFDMNRAIGSSVFRSANPSRAVSPFSRRSSPPRSMTPLPGLSLKNGADELSKANELLRRENERLRALVDGLRNRCDLQELELQKSGRQIEEATAAAAEESAKSKAAKEVIRTLTAQLKDMAERMPSRAFETMRNGSVTESSASRDMKSSPFHVNGFSGQQHQVDLGELDPPEGDRVGRRVHVTMEEMLSRNGRADGSMPVQGDEDGSRFQGTGIVSSGSQVDAEWIVQYEPGVYITLSALRDGTRDLKRVRFSRRRFKEQQAENWWSENRDKVYERYNVRGSDRASSVTASTRSIH